MAGDEGATSALLSPANGETGRRVRISNLPYATRSFAETALKTSSDCKGGEVGASDDKKGGRE